MRQARFRVAKISFYIWDYTFYLSSLQISGPTISKTTFPQFDNSACDRPAIWRKVQMKRRFPNKLGTRNLTEILIANKSKLHFELLIDLTDENTDDKYK